ncbi:peptidase inhibitor family I36 protein [Nonomuraea sp. MCN248]|uniref:Peptidase inhibitor family I36 protein n=1 Tax=Nonomuraea corallina TaxID=2989783 RepID=A0ABT4SHF2_9ACTN|nr:peptidase inhibitor family I36 protein [Nonomuraea corallina]MDA0636646.1 peptidase inhibitor family I36 protein [Nonomuraea corallina]
MRLSSLMATLVIAPVAAVLLASAPAEASPRSACFHGRVCLYAGSDFNRGQVDLWRDFVRDDVNMADDTWLRWDYTDSSLGMNNDTTSARNRVGCPVTLWQNPYFTGAHSTLGPGTGDGLLTNNPIGDNRASSLDIWCR